MDVVVKVRRTFDRYWFNREVAMYQALHSVSAAAVQSQQDKSSASWIPRMYRHFDDPEKDRCVIELEHVPCVSRHFVPANHAELSQFLRGLAKACLLLPPPRCIQTHDT